MNSNADVNEEGFVKGAYFQGSPRKVQEICRILGIRGYTKRYKKKATLFIGEYHKITPKRLEEASKWWDSH